MNPNLVRLFQFLRDVKARRGKLIVGGTFVLLVSTGCAKPLEVGRVETSVYLALLRHGFSGQVSGWKVCHSTNVPELIKRSSERYQPTVGVDTWAVDEEWLAEVRAQNPSLAPSAVLDFGESNGSSTPLPTPLLSLLGQDRFVDCSARGFVERHGPTLEFSAIGFSEDQQQALVYAGTLAGQATQGWLFMMRRDGVGGWVIDLKTQAWIA